MIRIAARVLTEKYSLIAFPKLLLTSLT